MRFVFVLEDDKKFQKDIVDAILGIDPKIQIRLFADLKQFAGWVNIVIQEGPAAVLKGGESPSWLSFEEPKPDEPHQLVAVVSKIEFLGARQLPLLKKTRDLFIKKGICTKEDPTAFVLTTFDEPNFKMREVEDRILNNIIFKPFDPLILSQHLTFAIDGRHPPTKYSISNQKTTAIVEMLKEVQIEALAEIGFVTKSNRDIQKGKVSKYYGASFSAGPLRSLMAMSLDSKEDPKKPGEFICSFYFFGVDPIQISSIRRKQQGLPGDFAYDWKSIKQDRHRASREAGIVIIDEDETARRELADSIQRKFNPTKVVQFRNLIEFLFDLDPKLAESQQTNTPPKGLPQDKDITFLFNFNGNQILDFQKESKEAILLFGQKESDIKHQASWWSLAMGSDQMTLWKKWLQSPHDITFNIRIGNYHYYLRPTSLDKDPNTQNYKVKFKELTTEERHQFLISQSKIPQLTDIIIVSNRFIKPDENEKWLKIKDLLKDRAKKETSSLNPAIFIVAAKTFSDSELRQFGNFVQDIFYRPIERGHFFHKLLLFLPELKVETESIEFTTIKKDEIVYTANPVQISEISEAGLVMQYYRPISLGGFRDFILWQPYEAGAPRLIGTCNFSEETTQKGIFNNHFVFFGMTDHYLKAIRLWIRDNYILSKESS